LRNKTVKRFLGRNIFNIKRRSSDGYNLN